MVNYNLDIVQIFQAMAMEGFQAMVINNLDIVQILMPKSDSYEPHIILPKK